MNWFFDAEKPLMQGLSAIADLMILNFLMLLCSLPIFTAGAALTAGCAVAIRMLRGEETSVLRDFFHAFRAGFKTGTIFGLLLLVCAGAVYFDYLAALVYVPQLRPVIGAVGIGILAVALYAFALMARYENPLKTTLKNAALLAIGYFPKTLGMTAFFVCFWALAIRYFRYGAPILLLFGLSLPIYVSCIFMNDIFNKLENNKV